MSLHEHIHLMFRLSAHGARWLKPIAMRIATRIMGLLLAALAIQFVLNAVTRFDSPRDAVIHGRW